MLTFYAGIENSIKEVIIMYRYVLYISLILFSISIFIHGNASAQDDVIAKVGERKITLSDLNRTIGYFDSQRQKMINSNPQLKENLLRQLVQSIVIANLAKKAGYDKNPKITEQLEFFKDNLLANIYLQKEVSEKITVSEEDISSYYKTHQDDFKTPEMVKARHILVKVDAGASKADKKKAKEKAEGILKKIKSGEDFEEIASELSDDTFSKSKGGDLGFFTRGRMVKSFEDAAFSLKPGEISDIVETKFGYHIIKLDEKKEEGVEPYDTAKIKIKENLLKERTRSKVSEFMDKAMKDANVEFHIELLTGGKKQE